MDSPPLDPSENAGFVFDAPKETEQMVPTINFELSNIASPSRVAIPVPEAEKANEVRCSLFDGVPSSSLYFLPFFFSFFSSFFLPFPDFSGGIRAFSGSV
jgi:hypothetical protein